MPTAFTTDVADWEYKRQIEMHQQQTLEYPNYQQRKEIITRLYEPVAPKKEDSKNLLLLLEEEL